MPQLALYLFGPPRLQLDGEPLHISRRKAMALLVYLAVTAKPHSRDALAALLWPENDRTSARGGLRRILSSLNRTLGSGWLNADRETICLNTHPEFAAGSPFWLDVAEFQAKLEACEGHDHGPKETCPDCLPVLEEALALCRDDFMAGFNLVGCREYEEWQFFQADEVKRQLTNALARLSSHFTEGKDFESAINYARLRLSLDPLHEPAHRQLMTLYDRSGQRAAALRQYQTCREVLHEELGVEPSQETQDHYQQIKTKTLVSLPESRSRHNLPVQATPFIGREKELAEIRAKLMAPDCRLLTLLGPGGSGKTRLAIEAVGQSLGDFEHGIFFVNLASLEDPGRIPTAIAAALSFSFFEEGTPKEQLLDYLRNKEMLLILDNFEHLLAGSNFVNQILKGAPKVKILTTSRSRLNIIGEHLFDVWGMAYPKLGISLEIASQEYSAIKLFEAEASRVQGDFQLNDHNLKDVIRICELLEGIPLGIVLAAAWAELLAPKEIAAEITRNLEFLQTELVDMPQRQRSLRGVFNHSWQLLSDHEREIFRALSVFQGGFTQGGARMVAGASLKDLMRLAHKSILHRVSADRYEVHELLRQYAAEKLESDPASEKDIRGKHSGYFCQALIAWERELQGERQAAAQKEMTLEIDNIRAAWEWAIKQQRFKLLLEGINGMCDFYVWKRQRLEGKAICQDLSERLALLRDSDSYQQADSHLQVEFLKLQARTLLWGGRFNLYLGNLFLSHKLFQGCLAILESGKLAEQDTRLERAMVLFHLSYDNQKSWDERIGLTRQALKLFVTFNEPRWQGNALRALADFTESTSRTKCIQLYQESLAVRRKHGDLRGIADSLERLSWFAASQFQFDEAEAMLREALSISTELQDDYDIVSTTGSFVVQRVWQGRFDKARTLVRETKAAYHNMEYQQSFAALFHARSAFPDQYLGEYEVARSGVQRALKFLEDTTHYGNLSHPTIEILGNIALGEGLYSEAQECFQECLPLVAHVPDKITRLLGCQGLAARGLEKDRQAQGYFYQGLKGAVKLEHYFSFIHILPGIALLFLDQGEVDRAVALYALAATQGIVANSKWFADIAGDEIEAAAAELPSEVAEAAKARGRALDLWETAVDLLAELEEQGWNSAEQGSAEALQH